MPIPEYIYAEHSYLAYHFCLAAEKRGMRVDIVNLPRIAEEIESAKEALFPVGSKFNPRSNKQVLEWFNDRKYKLKDNSKDTIYNCLEQRLGEYGFESYTEFEDTPEDTLPAFDEITSTLRDLYYYKSSGKGVDPWFGEKYLRDGFIHPRYNFTGTSTLRFSSSSPNFQNVASNSSWGKKLKTLIIPRSPWLQFLSADSSNLEFRVCAYYAGIDVTNIPDVFMWLAENSGNMLDALATEMLTRNPPDLTKISWDAALLKQKRAICKVIFHATNYGVGITLLTREQLNSPYTKNKIKKGALLVFDDWIYDNKIVAFSGVKLAQMVFKDQTDESRKKILDLQQFYLGNWEQIRLWQKDTSAWIDKHGGISTKWGTYLELLDEPKKNFKAALAKIGQGSGGEFVQGKMYEYLRSLKHNTHDMVWQIHDDIGWEIPIEWGEVEIKDFTQLLNEDSHRLPGFKTPWTVKKSSKSWGDLEKVA